MVMELLEGEDLGRVVKETGPLTADDAVDYVLQACAGLAEAHAGGIIHRDLKPANLFLARRVDTDQVIKIVDFGISKVNVAGVVGKLTDTHDLMGSPLYMSPEQLASSRDVDARTDIWSLGIILYELLTAMAPFDGDTLPQICSAVLITPAPPVLARRPDVPAGLSAVLAKCLEKKPSDRYASVIDLAHALAEFAPPRSATTLERIDRLSSNSRPPGERAPTPSQRPHLELVVPPMAETSSTWAARETLPPLPKSPIRTWLAVALVSLLVGSGGVFAFGHRAELMHTLHELNAPPVATISIGTHAPSLGAAPAPPPAPVVSSVPTVTVSASPPANSVPIRVSHALPLQARVPIAPRATPANAPIPRDVPPPGSAWTLDPEGSATQTPPSPSAKAPPGPYDEE